MGMGLIAIEMLNGTFIIGELESEAVKGVHVSDPLLFMPTQDQSGRPALAIQEIRSQIASFIKMEEGEPIFIKDVHIARSGAPTDHMAHIYEEAKMKNRAAASGIVVPDKGAKVDEKAANKILGFSRN